MLETQGYKYTHMLCNTYCCSTETLVARKRLDVTLHVYSLSCFDTELRLLVFYEREEHLSVSLDRIVQLFFVVHTKYFSWR